MGKVDQKNRAFAPVRLGVLGCGTVGAAFVTLVQDDQDAMALRSGIPLEIAKVAVRDRSKHQANKLAAKLLTDDAEAVVTDPDIDIVVELIGGIEPARTLILQALEHKKSVVSANKELFAAFGSELFAAAAAAGRGLYFEGSVAGAIPLLRALRVSLRGERVRRVMGIVNGTTNYILTRMSEEGLAYERALEEAQQFGYAESEPQADVEGFDAASKAAIIAGIVFNAVVTAEDVYREGITSIEPSDIEFARRLGYEVKLLAVAEQDDDPALADVAVRVHPAMVPVDHPLAGVRGPFNAVFVEGDAAGELMLYGRGAGGLPTASAVLGDVLDAAGQFRTNEVVAFPTRQQLAIRPIDDLRTQYYISIDVLDRPGVLAAVAAAFGRFGVSIRLMEQVGLFNEARLVFITHTAREADVQATLGALRELDSVRRVGSVLRVIGPER